MKENINESIKGDSAFNKSMYGALLRHQRMEHGYRKGEDFIADLSLIGLDIPKSTLYRIERGVQEPTPAFIMATNLLLLGNIHSGKIVDACIPEAWVAPDASGIVMRLLKKNDVFNKPACFDRSSTERAAYYEEIMSGVNSYDFDIFPNNNCTEDELYMTVMYGRNNDLAPELESYLIEDSDDVERSIINFLKTHDFDLSGKEVDKLVRYGQRKMKSQLEEHEII